MTQMNVQMSLTLADTASGPLRAFTTMLEGLGRVATGVGTKLEAVALGIGNVGKAAAGAASVNTFSASLGNLSMSMGTVESSSAGLTAAFGNIERVVGAMSGVLTSLNGTLAATAAEMRSLSSASQAVGLNMGSGFQSANTHASTLMGTMKGLAKIYAAMKIEKGIKASIGDAVEYQNTQTRLLNMNVSSEDRAAMVGAANATSRAVPQFSQNQTLEMGIDLRNATGSVEHALHMLTPFAIAAYDMKMATPAGQTFNDRDMLLIAKALEQRNATMDPAKMQAELDMMTKIYAATQGRVDANQILGNLQYSKGGLGQSLDLSFMPMLAAMIEQIKAGGGNGGQIGTALTSLQQSVLNGTGNGQAQKERARLGLIDGDKLVWNSQGNISAQKSDLRMAGADQFQRNPYEWVQNILKPAMVRAGIDLTNDAAVNQTLNKLFPNRNAANIAATMINRGALLEKDAANINQTADGRAQYENNVKTAQANIDAFKAQLENLGIVLGTTLLPTITKWMKGLTEVIQDVSDYFTAHPLAAQFATWTAIIGGVALAIFGVIAVFGLVAAPLGIAAGSVALFVGEVALIGGALVAAGFAIRNWLREIGWIKTDHAPADPRGTSDSISGGAGGYAAPGGSTTTTGSWGSSKSSYSTPPSQDANSNIPIDTGGSGWAGDKKMGGGLFKPAMLPGNAGRAGTASAATPHINTEWRDPFGDFISGLEAEEQKKLAKLDKDAIDLKRELLLSSGQKHAAEMLHVQQEMEAKIQALLLAHRITDEEATAMRARSAASVAYAEQQGEIAKTQEAYADKIASIDSMERNGTLSHTAAETQKLALLKEESDALDVLIAKLRELAVASGNDKAVTDLDKLGVKNRTTKSQLPAEDIQMLHGLQSGFEGMFKAAMHGKNGLEAFGQSIKNTFTDIISKKLGDALFDSLFGPLMKGGGSSGGGMLGNLMSGAASFFGFGGGGGGIDAAGHGFTPSASYAIGTDYVPRDMLAQIHQGERIIPARDNAALTRAMSGGGSPQTIMLQAHPDIMNMRFQDVLDAHVNHAMATR